MKRTGLSAILLVLTPGIASGGFQATVEFLGFSPDGEYTAMGQYWICDGSGAPGAELVVITVPGDSVAWSYRVLWQEEHMYVDGEDLVFEESVNPAMDSVMAMAEELLDSLGISDKNRGVHCIHHPLTDIGADPDSVTFVPWLLPSLTVPDAKLTLRIWNQVYEQDTLPDWLWTTPVLLELLLTGCTGDTLIHRCDSTNRPFHWYVWQYRIRDVYVYRNRMTAIILNTLEAGFEGPDGMYRMVTGEIDY